jgi:CheY-like chemotaxis protein
VDSAARSLLGIINDLLDYSKIEAGRLELDPTEFTLRAAVGETLRALSARAHKKGLELLCDVRTDVPDGLVGDAARLRQVLMNLVGNAIKFTAEGEVALEVAIASPAGAADDAVRLAFTVRDSGIGIAREKQSAIFRAFEQEDSSTTRRYGGTGLGLTIASQIAALMGGGIDVDSELGRGSTFTFVAAFRRSSAPSDPSPALRQLEGLRVLVVDDNESNRRILASWLASWRAWPAAVADASSALEALAREEARGEPFGMVLLDSRMPDIDGLTLAGMIRQRFASARLVLLSSDDSMDIVTRSRAAGIHIVLLKPVQQAELIEAMAAATRAQAVDEAPPPLVEEAARPSRAPGAGLKILVAEDNELNVTLVSELLAQRGHRVQIVNNGRSALALASEGAFDLLLLDLHMPEMDGFEVVRAVREHERGTGRRLPIIALTARSAIRDRARCVAAGMDDFLSKPVEARALWSAIDHVAAAVPGGRAPSRRLLDPQVILRACGGRPDILSKLCAAFQRSVPDYLARCRAALEAQDLPGLRLAAHLCQGTLAAFSTIAGALASTLEETAMQGDIEKCAALLERLDGISAELVTDTGILTVETLGA